MAMIVCPHCGEQVSEKAKKCVHCGEILILEEKKHCTECGVELEEGMTECPNCGCPVDDTIGQETDEKPQKVEVTGVKVTKKIKVIIGIVIALLVVGGATVFGVTQYQKKKAAEEYAQRVEEYSDNLNLAILVEYRINPKYPCKRLMEEARKRLAEILDINEPTEFFKTVDKKRDDLLDDAEDTAPVFDFFKGDQRKIFEEAVKNLAYFGNSKTYVSDQELLKVVEEIETIVKDSKPFGKIQRLPELNKRFEELHMGLLEKEAAIMDPLVHDDFLKVKEVLDTKPFAEVLRPRINQRFDEIWEKLRTSSDIAAIKNIKLESDTLKIKCLDEIDEYERAHQPAPEPPVAPVVPGKEPIEPIPAPTKVKTKRRKNVSISNVAGARTYSIETEQDIDKFLAEMKQKLMNELEEDTIITLS